MSDSDTLPDATGDVEVNEIERMMADLDTAIEAINDKIESGRIRNPEKEKVRLKHYRTLGYLIRTKRKLVEDKTLDELAAEVEELREAQEQAQGSGSDSDSGSGTGEITLGNRSRGD